MSRSQPKYLADSEGPNAGGGVGVSSRLELQLWLQYPTARSLIRPRVEANGCVLTSLVFDYLEPFDETIINVERDRYEMPKLDFSPRHLCTR